MKLGILCSGGKDSLYACHLAMKKEEVACLISVESKNPESYMFHTPNIAMVGLQSRAAGIPLVSVKTAGEEEAELSDLSRAIALACQDYGIEGVVTGAILSVYQASRIQRICNEQDIWCFNPLWHTDQESYLNALLSQGFSVIIAGVFSSPFDESWLGKILDPDVLSLLKRYALSHHITITGEGGEFETFVLDAPFFSKRILIDEAETSYANHHGVYRITRARLVDK